MAESGGLAQALQSSFPLSLSPSLPLSLSPSILNTKPSILKQAMAESGGLAQALQSSENNYFPEMCSGSEEGSYLRLIDFWRWAGDGRVGRAGAGAPVER